jgi:hypothetical protein
MNQPHDRPTPSSPRGLTELFIQYLHRQSTAHAEGLGLAEAAGEVEPYEAVPVQPVDPRVAWSGACAAAEFYSAGVKSRTWKAPAEWPNLVASHDPETALPFCLGNFPQMVRDLHPFWQAKGGLVAGRRSPHRNADVGGVPEWAATALEGRDYLRTLLGVGVLRLAGRFDDAGELLARCRSTAPSEWEAVLANEEAALLWHQGRTDEAASRWNEQPDSAAVLFNRGLAALFRNRATEARTLLSRAAGLIPEGNAWHHLALLYLALAEIRS